MKIHLHYLSYDKRQSIANEKNILYNIGRIKYCIRHPQKQKGNDMGIIETKDLVFEYIRRDEEGNVEGITRAVDEVDLDIQTRGFCSDPGA